MSVRKWSFWISPLVALFVFVDVVGTGGALAASVVMGDGLPSTNTRFVPVVTIDAAASSSNMETGSTNITKIGSTSTTETGRVSTFETANTSITETGSISTFDTVSASTTEARNTTETESTTRTVSTNTFETGSTSTFGTGNTNTIETETTSTFDTGRTSTFKARNTTATESTTGTVSTNTFETGSTSTFGTGNTNTIETETTSTFDTGRTSTFKARNTTATESTTGTVSTNTFETGSTSTFGTGNTNTLETRKTSETESTSTFDTGSTSTFKARNTTATESTTGTVSTNNFETGSTSIFDTGSTSTFDTGSTSTFDTGSTSTFDTGSTSTFETESTTGTGSETRSSFPGVTEPCQQQQLCLAGVCVPGCSSPSYSVQTSPGTRDTGSGSTARNSLLHFVTTVIYRGGLSARLAQPLSKGSDVDETSTMVSTLAPPSTQTHSVTSRNTSRGESRDVFLSSIMDTLREFNSVVQTTGEHSPLDGTGHTTGPAEGWEGIGVRTDVTAPTVATSGSTETMTESTQGMTPPTKSYSESTPTAGPTLPTEQSSLTSAWPTKTTENSTPVETSSTPTMIPARDKWAREEPTQTFSEPTRTTPGFKGEEYTTIFSESTGDPNQIGVDTTSRSSPALYGTTQYNYWEEIMGERAVFVDSTPSYTGPGLVPHGNNSQGFFDFGFLLPEEDSFTLSQTTFPSTTKTSTSVDAQSASDSTTTTTSHLSTTSGTLDYVSTSHVAVLPDEREAHDLLDRKSSSIGPEKLPEDAIIAGVRSTSWPRDVRSTSPAPGPVAPPTTHTSNVNDIHANTENKLNSEDPETIAKKYLPPLPEDEAPPHVGQHQEESQYLQILLVAAPSAVAFLSLLGLTCLTCCMCKHRYRRWMAVRRAKRRMQVTTCLLEQERTEESTEKETKCQGACRK
ncbi:uncharacterized protein LOC112572534 isoform X3 [Pomacea canaliculata]|uniref:uncharacterized protein LOC112572534 isoform X3 n=1 Tax=Pomacea canaliculata TaxID=400727 RepID=UPI000D738644|nr:uncharacterized protein LOC112572534 isoform X3 [Pomacea canaliculata]